MSTNSKTNLKSELAKIKGSVSDLETPKAPDYGKEFRSMTTTDDDSGPGDSVGGAGSIPNPPVRLK